MTVPFRILSLLLCLLIAGPMSLPAWALARPETRVGNFFPTSPKSAAADLDQTAGTRWENRCCDYDFASGVCKYLYCHANPVNMVDPSGHMSLISVNASIGIMSFMVGHEIRGANAALSGARALFGGDDVVNQLTYGLDVLEAIDNAVAVTSLAVGAAYGGYKLITFLSNGAQRMIKNLRSIPAEVANARWIGDGPNPTGWLPPYKPGTSPRQFTTAGTIEFKRVIVTRNGSFRREGSFLVRSDEIAGMSRKQIKDHLGLDDLPSHIQDVHVPQGVEMRVGFAGEQPAFGSKGGGVQYEILSEKATDWFGQPVPLGGQ